MSKMCSICQTSIEARDATIICDRCQCEFHAECWQDNGGCATAGCENVPKPLKKDGELPGERTYWGAITKTCPSCGETIKVGEIVCPCCNESFGSAEPINPEEFKNKLIGHHVEVPEKKIAIIIFICGLLGCTAPLNLIIGGVWYREKRRLLREASPIHNLLAVVGLSLSLSYCVILFLILLFKR